MEPATRVCAIVAALCTLCALIPHVVAEDIALPVVLPPYQNGIERKPEYGSCLFYMEGLNINVFSTSNSKQPMGVSAPIRSGDNSTNANKYVWDPTYVNCITNKTEGQKSEDNKFSPQDFSFTLDLKLDQAAVANSTDQTSYFSVEGNIKMTLDFLMIAPNAWRLTGVSTDGFTIKKGKDEWLDKDITVPKSNATAASLDYLNFATSNQYSYACGQTRSVVFASNTSDETKSKEQPQYEVGVQFVNIQVQAMGIASDPKDNKKVQFTSLTEDCVGTFTQGSWMGIIVALVLVSVMMFGYLMLNSVQTIDRFDDPKQKQLIVNAKD